MTDDEGDEYLAVVQSRADFRAEGRGEMDVHAGELLLIAAKSADDMPRTGWMHAYRLGTGTDKLSSGYVPASFMTLAYCNGRMLASFVGEHPSEVAKANVGDAVWILEQQNFPEVKGWVAVLHEGGECGYVPATYVDWAFPDSGDATEPLSEATLRPSAAYSSHMIREDPNVVSTAERRCLTTHARTTRPGSAASVRQFARTFVQSRIKRLGAQPRILPRPAGAAAAAPTLPGSGSTVQSYLSMVT
jgi:hypothetical protein